MYGGDWAVLSALGHPSGQLVGRVSAGVPASDGKVARLQSNRCTVPGDALVLILKLGSVDRLYTRRSFPSRRSSAGLDGGVRTPRGHRTARHPGEPRPHHSPNPSSEEEGWPRVLGQVGRGWGGREVVSAKPGGLGSFPVGAPLAGVPP